MTERRCVFTVLVGGYEELVEQPTAADSGLDYLCFTDDRSLRSSSWQIRSIDPVLPADPVRSSRFPKIMTHRFLDDYDASLYIDNAVLLARAPEAAFDELLSDEVGFAAMRHAFRSTLADEFAAVVAAGRDEAGVCDEQRMHYLQHYPGILDAQPLVGGFLLRRHHRPDVVAAMELWWYHVLRYSHRDQLSLPVVLQRTNLAISALDLDIRDNEFCEWPIEANRRHQPSDPLTAANAGISLPSHFQNER